MTDAALACWRCGASLARLSLPLSRYDECPECGIHLHVCKMCRHWDRRAIDECRLEETDWVKDKERPNFCDYFSPSADAHRPDAATQDASRDLEALFGGDTPPADEPGPDALEDLFKK